MSSKLNVKDKDRTGYSTDATVLHIFIVRMCTTCLLVSLIIKCVYTMFE